MRLPGTQALAQPLTWKARWLELTVLIGAAAVAAVCLTHVWTAPLELVPLLAVPLFVPALIAGVKASGSALAGEPIAAFSEWLKILIAFDVLFLSAGYLLFEHVIGED